MWLQRTTEKPVILRVASDLEQPLTLEDQLQSSSEDEEQRTKML